MEARSALCNAVSLAFVTPAVPSPPSPARPAQPSPPVVSKTRVLTKSKIVTYVTRGSLDALDLVDP